MMVEGKTNAAGTQREVRFREYQRKDLTILPGPVKTQTVIVDHHPSESDYNDQKKKSLEVAMNAVKGRGVPVGIWSLFFVTSVLVFFYLYDIPFFFGKSLELDLLVVCVSVLVLWVAPLRTLGQTIERVGALKENVVLILPHIPELLPYLMDILPHILTLIENIDELAPLLDALMQEKELLLPLLPEILNHLEKLLPFMDLIGPRIHVIAPHAHKLLPHVDELIPYLPAIADYIDDLIPFLDVRGWEEIIPHLDAVLPHLEAVAPHVKRLVPHVDPLLPHLSTLVKYLDNLVPHMDHTVEVLDRLVPLLPLLPMADQTGILYSKLLCYSLPRVARILPSGGRSNWPAPASPLPNRFSNVQINFSIPNAQQKSDGKVYYEISLNEEFVTTMRYSELATMHSLMAKEISNYSKMKQFPFPDGTLFGKGLSDRGVERRRISLENYLERLAMNSQVLAEESPAFRAFLRRFYYDSTMSTIPSTTSTTTNISSTEVVLVK